MTSSHPGGEEECSGAAEGTADDLAGERFAFDPRLDLEGLSPFARKVLLALS